jgi:hypothetical protein
MQTIEWHRSDFKLFDVNDNRGTTGITLVHHAFLYRPGREVYQRLCLMLPGGWPDAIHVLRKDHFCASCIRRSLEVFR